MARFLTPRDYGLFGMVIALPGLVSMFGDFGAMRCLVQIRDLPDRTVRDSALSIVFTLSLFYATVATACGYWLGLRYGDSRLFLIGAIHGLNGILNMLYSFQLAGLSKELRFSSEARQNFIFAFAQAASGIVFVLTGFGVYSLVLQALCAQLIANAFVFPITPIRWPRDVTRESLARFWRLGWRITFSQYLNNVQGSLTNIAIGFSFTASALGQFGRACQIRDLAGQNLLVPFDRLLFSLFSNAQTEISRLRDVFVRGTAVISLFCSLAGILLCACGPEIIHYLLGSQWYEAGQILQILSVGLIFSGIGLIPIALCQALGEPLSWARFVVAQLTLTCIALALAPQLGLRGLSAAIVSISVIISFALTFWATKRLGIPRFTVYRQPLRVWAVSLVVLAGMLVGRSTNYYATAGFWGPIVLATVGTIVFVASLWIIDRDLLREIKHLSLETPQRPSEEVPTC